MRLSELDTAFVIEDLKLPGFDFHTLKGNKKGIWSIKFNGNCRLTLAYENKILIIENLDFQNYKHINLNEKVFCYLNND